MRVEWTEPALEDLAAIRDYIAKDSPHYARQFVEKVFATTDNLEIYPEIGRRVREAENKNIRELIYQGYRIIYAIKPDRIQILTVTHGRRNLSAQDPKPWDT